MNPPSKLPPYSPFIMAGERLHFIGSDAKVSSIIAATCSNGSDFGTESFLLSKIKVSQSVSLANEAAYDD